MRSWMRALPSTRNAVSPAVMLATDSLILLPVILVSERLKFQFYVELITFILVFAETAAKTGMIMVFGEITVPAPGVDYQRVL